jgi:septal ring factor EnvC (AmiA/AmiB activator)
VDGQWKIRDHNDLYVSRSFSDKNYNRPVSDSARKTIGEQLRAYWLGFVSVNSHLGKEAERAHLKNQLTQLQSDIEELDKQIDEKKVEQDKILAALKAIE